jgi:hypothetical protein
MNQKQILPSFIHAADDRFIVKSDLNIDPRSALNLDPLQIINADYAMHLITKDGQ